MQMVQVDSSGHLHHQDHHHSSQMQFAAPLHHLQSSLHHRPDDDRSNRMNNRQVIHHDRGNDGQVLLITNGDDRISPLEVNPGSNDRRDDDEEQSRDGSGGSSSGSNPSSRSFHGSHHLLQGILQQHPSSLNQNQSANHQRSGEHQGSQVLPVVKHRRRKHSGPPVRPTCQECGKDFSNQSALSKHKLTHSDVRRFSCQLCGKAFKRQDHLNGHMLTHRDKKPYECDVEGCEKTYCDARSLRRHKENHHASLTAAGPALGNKPHLEGQRWCPTSVAGLSSSSSLPVPHHQFLNSKPPSEQFSSTVGSSSGLQTQHLLRILTNPLTEGPSNQSNSQSSGLEHNSSIHQQPSLGQQPVHHHHLRPPPLMMKAISSHSMPSSSHVPQQHHLQYSQLEQNGHQGPHTPTTPHDPSTPNEVSQPTFTYPSQPYLSNSSQHVQQQSVNSPSCSVYSQPQSSPYDLHQPPQQLQQPQTPTTPGNGQPRPGYEYKVQQYLQQQQHLASRRPVSLPTTPVDGQQVFTYPSQAYQSHNGSNTNNGLHHSQQEPTTPCSVYSQPQSSPYDLHQPSQHMRPQLQHQNEPHTPTTPSMNHLPSNGSLHRVQEYLDHQLQDNRRPVSLPSTPIDVVGSASADTHGQVFTYPSQPYQSSSMQHHSRHHLSVPQEPTTPCSVYSQPQTSPYNMHLTPQPVQDDQMSRRTVSLPATPVDQQSFNYHQQQTRNFGEPSPAYSEISPFEAQHPPTHLQSQQQLGYPVSRFYSNGKTIRTTESSCLPSLQEETDQPQEGSEEQGLPIDKDQLSPQEVEALLRDIELMDSSMTSSQVNQGNRQVLEGKRGFFPNHPGKLQQQHVIASKNIHHSDSIGKNISNASQRVDNTVSVVVSSKTTSNVINNSDDNNNDKNTTSFDTTLKPVPLSKGKAFTDDTSALKTNNICSTINGKTSGKYASFASLSSSSTSSSTSTNVSSSKINNSVIKVSSPKRMRHKPEPLYIPPHVNACGTTSFGHYSYHQYQSRLRSPRLWDGKVPSHHAHNNHRHGPAFNSLGLNLPPNGLSSHHAYHPYLHLSYLQSNKESGVPGGDSDRMHSGLSSTLGILSGNRGISPPPYTPPPMLSPVRNGSGLYWHILSSGSLTPKTSLHHHLNREFLLREQTHREQILFKSAETASQKEAKAMTMVNGSAATGGHFFKGLSSCLPNDIMASVDASADITAPTPKTAYEPDIDFQSIPETDIQPHVNVGSQFQARIPEFNPEKETALEKYKDERADIVWDPSIAELANLSDDDIDSFLSVACSSCLPGVGRNIEYAYHVLGRCKGDLQEALRELLQPEPVISETDPLNGYHYAEADVWSTEEISSYHRALDKCDKDFNAIAKEVETKSVKHCIQFYYLWKKVCPDEYRRLRVIRRKREQDSIFYKRDNNNCEDVIDRNSSRDPLVEDCVMKDDCKITNDDVNSDRTTPATTGFMDSDRDEDTSNDSRGLSPAPSSVGSSIGTSIEYPCKVCGKVFFKLKSRGAHMKIHGKQQ